MKHHRSYALALCVLLAACNQQGEQKAAPVEGGEVLPGTISDAMIDLDTSTATPPLAAVKARSAAKASPDADAEADSPASDQAPAAAASGGTD
ncbi:MAG: hypothetical protein NTX28_16920 [Novosphingobium sp.]|nr:hypothetical protein [Novosphingobium sp.]